MREIPRPLRRVLLTLPVLWVVVSVVFLLIHLVPGDPIVQMLGEGATATDVSAMRHAYGLDAPLPQQYAHYIRGVAHADLGQSLRLHDSVTHLILERYPYTLALTLAALLLGMVLSIPAGIASALHRNRWQDRALGVVSLVGLSFPNFALGPILILLFSIRLGWLPVSGPGTDLPTFLLHLVLPAVTLGLSLAAILTRMVRTAMLEELSQDYIRTARAKGLTEKPGRLSPCAAQCADSDSDGGRATVWIAAGRSDRDGDDLQLAGDREVDADGDLEPRLCPGARMYSRGGTNVRGGQPADGRGVYPCQSTDAHLNGS